MSLLRLKGFGRSRDVACHLVGEPELLALNRRVERTHRRSGDGEGVGGWVRSREAERKRRREESKGGSVTRSLGASRESLRRG
eukprot:scaffold266290_cov28-Tisochrysis_lutea.AAC.3